MPLPVSRSSITETLSLYEPSPARAAGLLTIGSPSRSGVSDCTWPTGGYHWPHRLFFLVQGPAVRRSFESPPKECQTPWMNQ
jgi:hypothetical protein